MNLTDSRLAQAGNERLELAMLSFFEQFRKIYIGDQVQKSSKVNKSNRSTAWNELGPGGRKSAGISRPFVVMLAAALSKEPFMSRARTRQQFRLIDSLGVRIPKPF